jgi:hypothetical protein
VSADRSRSIALLPQLGLDLVETTFGGLSTRAFVGEAPGEIGGLALEFRHSVVRGLQFLLEVGDPFRRRGGEFLHLAELASCAEERR